MTKIPYKIFLSEEEMPKYWYNIKALMNEKPDPFLNPATLEPVTAEELEQLFCKELVEQELNTTDQYIEIPEGVREFYKCIALLPWYALTVWKNYWIHLQKYTISSKVQIPPAPIS
jgi:predicted alternative tryptophan synthase beta-subunit